MNVYKNHESFGFIRRLKLSQVYNHQAGTYISLLFYHTSYYSFSDILFESIVIAYLGWRLQRPVRHATWEL